MLWDPPKSLSYGIKFQKKVLSPKKLHAFHTHVINYKCFTARKTSKAYELKPIKSIQPVFDQL